TVSPSRCPQDSSFRMGVLQKNLAPSSSLLLLEGWQGSRYAQHQEAPKEPCLDDYLSREAQNPSSL
ncbi:MAG: hypothetical protein ACO3XO_05890, partial [Bdellovibrionota bacterium]